MKRILILFVSFSVLLSSCSDDDNYTNNKKAKKVAKQVFTKVISPKYNSNLKLSDTVLFSVSGLNNIIVDSFVVKQNNKVLFHSKSDSIFYFNRVGVKNLSILSYFNDTFEIQQSKVTVLANEAPKMLSFKLVNKFPKNKANFTQGLEFYNGELYESTGQKGDSRLEKIDLNTGKSKQSVSISSNFFGEGITFFNHQIFQITWKSNLCFLRDAKTFQEIGTYSYPTEGWGLTHNDTSLIMSDGSHQLYFINPEGFQETDKLEVYNSKSRLPMLNELEFVDDNIWANIYQYNYLAKINAKTGAVEALLDLTSLYNYIDNKSSIDVLNGIAYHPTKKTFFVTGKLWPYYFEIDINNQ